MTKYVYAIGNCADISNAEAREWRMRLDKQLRAACASCDNVRVIDITYFYGYEKKLHDTDSEIADFCLRAISKADAIVINNSKLSTSQGSGREIGYAKALNKPMFLVNEYDEDVYPWDLHWCERVFTGEDAIKDCASHILHYVFYDHL